VRLTTNLVDVEPDAIFVGQAVAVEFEHHEDVYIPVFRPISATEAS
jgi:hypothetical protein